jgi:phage FluMu protein Com
MAIKAPCPRCKHVTHLPDSAGGKLGRCKQCNAIVRVPLAESQRKYCSVCRADVSLTKRVKDPRDGRYFCAACWQSAREAASATGDDFWNALEDLDAR